MNGQIQASPSAGGEWAALSAPAVQPLQTSTMLPSGAPKRLKAFVPGYKPKGVSDRIALRKRV